MVSNARSIVPPTGKDCPFCRERIPQDVVKCHHCGSFLDNRTQPGKSGKQEQEPTLFSVLVANLFCPGLGSWRMGEKGRGGVILVVMLLCVIMTGMNYASLVSRQLDAAIDSQDDSAFESSFSSSGSTWWAALSGLVFMYSFVDILLIHAFRDRKKRGSTSP